MFSSKKYTALFLVFLVVFIVSYFIRIGINIHNLYFLHLHLDYVLHGLFSFTLFFLFIGSFDYYNNPINPGLLFISSITFALFVNSLEFVQMLIPLHSFDKKDIISNIAGMFIGISTQLLIITILRSRRKVSE